MNKPVKESIMYRLVKRAGFELPPEYARINLIQVIVFFLKDWKNNFFSQLAKRSILFGNTLSLHWIRQFYHRLRGVRIGRNTRIAEECMLGFSHPEMITLEDDVAISAKCMLLEHKRDLSLYRHGDSIMQCNYVTDSITLRKGCFLGIGSIVMPGVEVGEGAIVGAGSVVHESVGAYQVVQGNPAKVIFEFPKKRTDEKTIDESE